MRMLILLPLLLATACSEALPPQDVADRFWRAVVTRHPDKVKRWVRAADQGAVTDAASLPRVNRFELGRVVIEGGQASVATRVVLDAAQAQEMPLTTSLVQEDGAWRVDYQAVLAAVSGNDEMAEALRQLERLGDTLKDGIDRSVEGLEQALPKIEEELARFEAEFKERLPELRERIEEFRRRFEESLEPAPAPPQLSPPAGEPVEI
jgi:hypothetical protein